MTGGPGAGNDSVREHGAPGSGHPASSAAGTTPATAERLRAALDGLLGGLPPKQLTAAVDRLMTHYRGRTPTGAPVLRNRADAVAYAAYRMPATCRAMEAALTEFAARLPGWAPESQLDVGGGTGAAVWAASGVWPGARPVTVLDWAGPALDLGRELAGAAAPQAVRETAWQRSRVTGDEPPDLPGSGLVTISYVLGELPEVAVAPLVAAAAAAAPAVVIVEPGTPEGYRRVLRARDGLAEAGMRVLAPCPHSGACPIAPGDDWCHFATRVSRSALHRRVKGGELPYEDEKYAYVAAVHPALVTPVHTAPALVAPAHTAPALVTPALVPSDAVDRGNGGGERRIGDRRIGDRGSGGPEEPGEPGKSDQGTGGPEPAPGRVVRRPQQRKGQVLLDVCTRDDGLRRTTVTRRDRERYRAARNTTWGDPWE